jgi:hypothetical protein
VSDGHGLLMAGLGWSWPHEIATYPMMRLAAAFEIAWLRDTISDQTNQLNGSPVFHTFYPAIGSASTPLGA